MALGFRDTIRVVEEEKEVTKFIEGKSPRRNFRTHWQLLQVQYLYFTELKLEEAISEDSRAGHHEGRCVCSTHHVQYVTSTPGCMVCQSLRR